jgi:recombination protein RecT
MATQTAGKEKASVPATTGAKVPAADKKPTLAMEAKSIVDAVESRIQAFMKAGQLDMPKDYSVSNALKSAWLVLQGVKDKNDKPALQVCTRDSIANSLLDMVVQGLNPQKKQGYFIVYGQTLTFQRSYFGAMAVTKMVNPKVGDFAYAVVYEGDTFKYGIKDGRKMVTLHEQDIKNVKKDNIIAAYCIVFDTNNEIIKTEIMTVDEIHAAWKKSKTAYDDNGKLKAISTHAQYSADMSLRTVINKACKFIINASSDNALLLERINRNEDLADAAAVQEEIAENANTGDVLQITDATEAASENVDTATGEVLDAETHVASEEQSEPVCVCQQMIKEGQKKFDCSIHGRYDNGKYAPIRKPGF